MPQIVIKTKKSPRQQKRVTRTLPLSNKELRNNGFGDTHDSTLPNGRKGFIAYTGELNYTSIICTNNDGRVEVILLVNNKYYYSLTFAPDDIPTAEKYFDWINEMLSERYTAADVGQRYGMRLKTR